MAKTKEIKFNDNNTKAYLEAECASSRKLKATGSVTEFSNNDDNKYFMFIDIEQMKIYNFTNSVLS